ncbi:MAG: MFS transporter [Bacteroidaceae bacterium]|nr:MFS transporter [Bacteroidaceae bacterium]
MKKNSRLTLIPVMLCFFAMGFVDLVGFASNYVKADFQLNDATANIFPSLVFFWFLIFGVPTGMLMNRIGRKKTVMLSMLLTVAALVIPLLHYSFATMAIAFSLLGIGNAIMQTSLNPLVASITGGKNLSSTLTFGQFIKAIASFVAPYLAMWGATQVIPTAGLDWRVLFGIFLVVGAAAMLLLGLTPIEEEKAEGRPSTFAECLSMLGTPVVLLSFLAIVCHVGIDVGVNTTAPKILMERLGLSLNEAAKATSLYFAFRTLGCLSGAAILRMMKGRTFFAISMALMAISLLLLFTEHSQMMLYVAIALAGLGNSNLFSIIMANAMTSVPEKQNEVSGLMIMGIVGGAIFPPVMGFMSDQFGQAGAILILALGAMYLFTYIRVIKD